MIRALYSAASGMTAQQMNVDNIANNLANANTTGFKMRRTQFQDLLYQSYVQPGAAAGSQTIVPSGLQIGSGHAARLERDHLHAGQFSADRQSAGPGDSGQRVSSRSGGRPATLAYTRAGTSNSTATATSSPPTAIPLSRRLRFPPRRKASPSPPTERSATRSRDRPRRRWPGRFSSPTSPIRPA